MALQEEIADESAAKASTSTSTGIEIRAKTLAPRWAAKGGTPCTGSETGIISEVTKTTKTLDQVTKLDGDWERISIKVDSGAVDTVMPPSVGCHFGLTETAASRNGPGFTAANGSAIEHYGQRSLKGQTDQFKPVSLVAQVAGVKTPLASVSQMLRAGNRVHFETGNCYIQHVATGAKTKVIERNGAYEVGMWVPKAKPKHLAELENQTAKCTQTTGHCVAKGAGFARQDEGF